MSKPKHKTTGQIIREAREEQLMAITSLSEKSGVSTGTISYIERDEVSPSIDNLMKLVKALGLKIEDVV